MKTLKISNTESGRLIIVLKEDIFDLMMLLDVVDKFKSPYEALPLKNKAMRAFLLEEKVIQVSDESPDLYVRGPYALVFIQKLRQAIRDYYLSRSETYG